MKVTEVRFHKSRKTDWLEASGSFTLDECINIHFELKKTKAGKLWISLPKKVSKNKKTDEWDEFPLVVPTSKEAYNVIQEAIMEAYEKEESGTGQREYNKPKETPKKPKKEEKLPEEPLEDDLPF